MLGQARVEQIAHRRTGDGPGRVQQEEHPDQRGERVEVQAPAVLAQHDLGDQRGGHQPIEGGLGKPQLRLRREDGRLALAQLEPVAKEDAKANHRIGREDQDAGQRALDGLGETYCMRGLHQDEPGARHHHHGNGHADQVLELADAIGKAFVGRSPDRTQGEVRRQHGEKVGALLEGIAQDGQRVGRQRRATGEQHIDKAHAHSHQQGSLMGVRGRGDAHG